MSLLFRNPFWKPAAALPLVLTIALLAGIPCLAKPDVSRANIKLGQSMRLSRNTWSTLSCRINNPDKKPHEITLRLVVAEGFSLGQRNTFSDVVKVPAETAFDYRTPVMVENAEKYRLDVFVDGEKQAALGEDITVSQLPASARADRRRERRQRSEPGRVQTNCPPSKTSCSPHS